MAGPVNIWAAGQDALLRTLALRDAEERLNQDRARQATLDQEAREDRERYRDYQDNQLARQQREDDARIRLAQDAMADKQRAEREEAAHKQLRRDAIYEFRTTKDENRRKELQDILSLEYEMRFEKPEVPKPQLVTMRGPKGQKIQKWVTPKEGESYESYSEPDAGAKPRDFRLQIANSWDRALSQAQSEARTQGGPPDQDAIYKRAKQLRNQYLIDLEVDPAQHPLAEDIPPRRGPIPKGISGELSAGPMGLGTGPSGGGTIDMKTAPPAVRKSSAPASAPAAEAGPIAEPLPIATKTPPAPGGRVRVVGPDGETGTIPAESVNSLPKGWKVEGR